MKELLGCEPEVFKYWLEFSSESIDNPTYDHIIPCKWFQDQGWNPELEQICFHWSNYRLCTQSENSSKHNTIYPQLIKDYRTIAEHFIEHCKDIDIQISVLNPLPKVWVAERSGNSGIVIIGKIGQSAKLLKSL